MKEGKTYTVLEIRDKLANYCAYQDRCQWDVENKMAEFTLIPEARDEIMIYLIQEKFLNEERFAKSFARGKFYQKNWGKIKITNELKRKKIPPRLIQTGLKEIDELDYRKKFEELFQKKKESLRTERNSFKKKSKIQNYLLQKGYESFLIFDILIDGELNS